MKKYIATPAHEPLSEGKGFRFYFTALRFAKKQPCSYEIAKHVGNGTYKHIKFV